MYKLKRSMALLLVGIMLLMPFTTILANAENTTDEGITIETTLKNMTTKADKLTFDVWAKDSSGKKIGSTVTNNGESVAVNWDDDEKTSFTLQLDLKENTVVINAGGISKTYTLYREPAEDGEVIGTFTFSLDAFTVGLGYLIEPIQVDIHKGQNAAQALDKVLTDYKYEYEHTGSLESSFYLATLLNGENTVYKEAPSIPKPLKDKLEGNYDEEDYSSEYGLGEFDFNNMSGWMYAVNNVFPNVGFADKYLQDGDVMRVQFTLAYGNDIGGADAMGGGYENNMFPKVNKDGLTKKVAEINSSGKKEVYLKVDEIKDVYNNAITVLQTVNTSQQEIDKTLNDLEEELKKIRIISTGEIDDIEVDFGTSKEDALSELPEKIILNLSNENTKEVSVAWTSEEYNGSESGEYTFTGSYDLPEGVTGNKPKVKVKAVVKEEIITIEEIDLVKDIEVDFGTSKEDALSELPKKVTLNLSNGTRKEVDVSWTSEKYDGSESGEYIFTGNYDLPEDVTGDKPEVNVKVTVKEEPMPEIDKFKLEEAINKGEEVDTEGKTEESIKALEEAIVKGKEILGKEDVSQEEVDSAAKSIVDAINNLEDKEEPEPTPEIDRTKLEEVIKKGREVDIEDKTEESIKTLEEAIAKGKEILEKEEVTQEEIHNAAKVIEDAIKSLESEEEPEPIPEIDRIELEEVINKGEEVDTEDKTEESIKILEEAIVKGKELLGKEDTSQEEVDSAVKSIVDAINKLEDKEEPEPIPIPEIDKTKLEEAINKGEEVNTEGKTEESVKALKEAVAKGKEVLEKEKVTQEELDNVAKDIEEAIEDLKVEEKPIEPTKPEKSSKPEKPSKPQKPTKPGKIDRADKPGKVDKPIESNKTSKTGKTILPKTGESSMKWLSILGIILLVIGTGLWIRKRKEV